MENQVAASGRGSLVATILDRLGNCSDPLDDRLLSPPTPFAALKRAHRLPPSSSPSSTEQVLGGTAGVGRCTSTDFVSVRLMG